jgi:hypothetical protein
VGVRVCVWVYVCVCVRVRVCVCVLWTQQLNGPPRGGVDVHVVLDNHPMRELRLARPIRITHWGKINNNAISLHRVSGLYCDAKMFDMVVDIV